MFDNYDDPKTTAFMIYFFGVMFHGCLMALRGAINSDGNTLMTVAKDANEIAGYLYLIPGICYVIAALLCLLTDGWKTMVVMTLMIAAALPILVFITQMGVWLVIAVMVAIIAMAVLGVCFPGAAIVFLYCAPGMLVALFIMLIVGFFGFFATSVGF